MIATLFALENLKRRNELVAILSLGYPIKRVISDIVQISSLIMLFLIINNVFLIPQFSKWRTEWLKASDASFKDRTVGDNDLTISFTDQFWVKRGQSFYSFKYFDQQTNTINSLKLYSIDNDKIDSVLMIQNAKYLENSVWLASGIKEIDNLHISSFPHYKEKKSEKIDLGMTPSSLSWVGERIKNLGILDLVSYIFFLRSSDVDYSGPLIYIYGLINSAIVCVLFALFPLSPLLYPNRRSGGFGKNAIITMVFGISYWLINSFFISLGESGVLSPMLSVFMTTFLVVIFILRKNLKKLSVI